MGKGNENIIFLIKYLFLLKKVIIFVPENVVIHPHRKRWGFLTENYIKKPFIILFYFINPSLSF
jgi:hypothetical protein